jgi:hypothetical protein
MIVELREYTLHMGQVPAYVKLYEEEGFAIQGPILGNLVGYYWTEVGPQNQIVHLWGYDSYEDRAERRARLQADERWQAYLAKIRPMIVSQTNRILNPSRVMDL